LDAYWLYLAVPPSRMAFSVYGAMLYMFLLHGAYIPRFRSHEMSTAIETRIRDCGGSVEYNTRVDKIMVKNGRVSGVETAQGDKISTNHVICNASPTLAYNFLLHPKSEVPRIAFKNVNARTEGVSSFVVYLGLDESSEALGLTEYSYFICDHMDLEKHYASLSYLYKPQLQACICLNAAIPDCSPTGTTLLSLTSVYQVGVWEAVTPENYVQAKRKVAEQLIDQFERATKTRIRDRIEEIEIATPQTFGRYTGAYKGSTYGYELETWDSIIPRIICLEEEQYISGLRFTGGSASLGPGYNSTLSGGRFAALQTLKDMEVQG
jgi:prolycopene isomerase